MKKRAKKLVPLMPILVRLGACEDARAWVRRRDFATFSEAWDACPNDDWMNWLLCQANIVSRSDRETKRRWFAADTAPEVREVFPADIVERALYDYAVREGLVS